ncbi:nucleotidyltransferase family protein [Parachitinimonas caeni]|uniref:Nucleotidyltransferase n=1 Tax=Parachitinimonas caeni TaxID=3031301 RepID=A0ABT7DZE1_9NEIS|nr:hypothetical protein [Parachitinimonas caeni]MDK2125436.1 hypothetical protein [Parachitinimonas caeni]
MPAARYYVVADEIIARLTAFVQGLRVAAVTAYASKPDFGDMDVIIEGGAEYDPLAIAKQLQATELVRNGDVTSIGISIAEGIFQIDLIRVPSESFDFALHYFSYNDMGNLFGRIGHKLGAKFGHLGLLYPLRDPGNSDHLIDEVLITNDFATALTLMGYDFEAFNVMRTSGGFNTLDDIFRYVATSPFMNRDIYLLDNRNHSARMRDAKRPTYTRFLAWLAQQPADAMAAYPWGAPGSEEREIQRREFLQRAFVAVPAFKLAYDAAMAAHARKILVHRYFNGDNVSALTGLSGKALGERMRHVRASFSSKEEFEQFFASADESTAAERIRRS